MVVASATPPAAAAAAGHSLQHPPYKEMIVAAVKALKDKRGSSAQAISKFIRSSNSDLPLKHGAILKRQLRRLKKRGVLIMVRHSYKLASAVDGGGVPDKGEKRRPGRPRKVAPASSEGERRKPGRPRKSNAEDSKSDSGVSVPKRKPGRPRKSSDVRNASDSTPKRKPGRPRKRMIAAPVVLVKRKSGRPPKSSLVAAIPGEERKWSHPPKAPAEAAQSGENHIHGGPPLASSDPASSKDKRRPGRPPKSSSDAPPPAPKLTLFLAPNEPVARAESSGKRKRGRPRKFSDHAIQSGESPADQPKDAATGGGPPSAKRKPGRPPGSTSKKPRGRPPMPTLEGPDTAALSIKRRGRPSKKKDLEPTA